MRARTTTSSVLHWGGLTAVLLAQSCALTTGSPPSPAGQTEGTVERIPPVQPQAKAEVPAAKPAGKPTNLPANVGKASWYGPGFTGKKTASGEIFDDGKFTAAHKTLPLGSTARVTNLSNGKSVKVEINDRGPYTGNRIVDLSRAAARAIGMVDDGIVQVRVEPMLDGKESGVVE